MYGSDPFGSVPFGAAGASPTDYEAMLDGSDELVYTVTLGVWNAATNTASTLYLGSAEWVTASTDIPPTTPFDGRLKAISPPKRSIAGDRPGINFTGGEGTITFSNFDAEYDDYVDDYVIDGREVEIRVGRKTDAFANHFTVFRGVAVDWFADEATVSITIRDKAPRLDVPVQPNLYAGTGGAEGGDDIAGKRKPLTLGLSLGIPLVLVDPANSIYQFADATMGLEECQATQVYDRGIALTLNAAVNTYTDLVAASPAAGTATSSKDGFVRLGAAPSGTVFVTGAGYFDYPASPTTVEMIEGLITSATDLTDNEIDHTSFDVVAAANTSESSLHVPYTESATFSSVIAAVMAGVGGWAGWNRRGELALGILDYPGGSPVAYFKRDEGDVIDLVRERLPSGVWPPPWRWRVGYQRNYTVFNDFAAAVPNAVKTYYSEPYLVAEDSDSAIVTDHPSAQDPAPVESYMSTAFWANFEAGRLLDLYSAGYHFYRITLPRRAMLLELGNVIHVTFPRWGLDAGRKMTVVEIDDRIDLSDGGGVDKVEVLAFG